MERRELRSDWLLSAIVPCFNEEQVITATHARLATALQRVAPRFEIIYVDDGSGDATASILEELSHRSASVRIIRLTRNFGHQLAVTAGLENATGDAVLLIDADLQDPPEVVAEMVAAWKSGSDVCYGQRLDRPGETFFKLLSASLFYRLINIFSEIPIPLDTGDFRLMDRQAVDAVLQMPERDRFIRGMVSWIGFTQTAIPYRRDKRAAGVSKYPFWKMVRFAVDGLLSFSIVPLRVATGLGFFVAALAMLGIAYALVLRLFTNIWVSGWTLMFISILFFSGVQLISAGIIGEYVGRIYREVKRRPLYLSYTRSGFEQSSTEASLMRGSSPASDASSDPTLGSSRVMQKL